MRINMYVERIPEECNFCNKKADTFVYIQHYFTKYLRFVCKDCSKKILNKQLNPEISEVV